jgi:hypothetical protein
LHAGELAGGELGEHPDGGLHAGPARAEVVNLEAAGEKLAGVEGDGGGQAQGGSHGRPPRCGAEANVCSHLGSWDGAWPASASGPPRRRDCSLERQQPDRHNRPSSKRSRAQ